MASEESSLDAFDAPDTDARQVYTFETDELTALCPFDFGGPDYYDLTIRYEPAGGVIEAKSLKQYLEGFRGREVTVEELAAEIHATVEDAAGPERLYVRLEQARRGGIEGTAEVGDRDLA